MYEHHHRLAVELHRFRVGYHVQHLRLALVGELLDGAERLLQRHRPVGGVELKESLRRINLHELRHVGRVGERRGEADEAARRLRALLLKDHSGHNRL